jgi:hypothetical protein
MNDLNKGQMAFAGIVCFWKTRRQPGQSTRHWFISVYESLSQAVGQRANAHDDDSKWKFLRIWEPGRKFLGFAKRYFTSGRETHGRERCS